MIMPTPLMVGVLMPVTAGLSMNMLLIMIVPASIMMDMVFTFFRMLTVFLHVTAPRGAATPTPLIHLLGLSQHLINYCLLRLCRHLVSSDELHGLLGYKSVHFLPLLLHQLLYVDTLIAEPSQVICDQVQVIAPFAPYQDDADLVGVLGECAPLPVLAHIASEHNHQKALAIPHNALQFRLFEGI